MALASRVWSPTRRRSPQAIKARRGSETGEGVGPEAEAVSGLWIS